MRSPPRIASLLKQWNSNSEISCGRMGLFGGQGIRNSYRGCSWKRLCQWLRPFTTTKFKNQVQYTALCSHHSNTIVYPGTDKTFYEGNLSLTQEAMWILHILWFFIFAEACDVQLQLWVSDLVIVDPTQSSQLGTVLGHTSLKLPCHLPCLPYLKQNEKNIANLHPVQGLLLTCSRETMWRLSSLFNGHHCFFQDE